MKKILPGSILWIFLLSQSSAAGKTSLPIKNSYCLADSSGFNTSRSMSGVSDRAINSIDNKYSKIGNLIQHRTERMLKRMEKKELALQLQLQSKDSVKAYALFGNIQSKYQQLLNSLHSPVDKANAFPLKQYVSGIDSLQTAFRFLSQPGINTNPANPQLQKITASSQQIQQVEISLQRSSDIQQFLGQREQQLRDQLSQSGLAKQLLGINKEVFYGQQQLAEYKEMINDKQKLEEKLLASLSEIPAFNSFMQKHSYLAQLFGLPQDYGSPTSLIGMQTKAQVMELIGQKFGNPAGNNQNGLDPSPYLQQQVQQAQGQISKLKDKLKALGSSGATDDLTMPEFKPNSEKTKTFLQRITYGFSMQTEPTTNFLPANADLAITIGYKLSSKADFGIGAGYRLGMGAPISHIAFSNQGLNLRSYFEWKAKGNWWLTGGIEYNYLQAFDKWRSVFVDPDLWQKSALIGLTKKIRLAKNRQSNVQVLFDALYKQHVPTTQPVIFRIGYEF